MQDKAINLVGSSALTARVARGGRQSGDTSARHSAKRAFIDGALGFEGGGEAGAFGAGGRLGFAIQ